MSRSHAGADFGYSMIKSGPDVNRWDVESDSTAIEVMVLWGSSVLRVVHGSPSRSFYASEASGNGIQSDCFVPAAALGATRAPLVVSRAVGRRLVLWPGARGHVNIPGEGRVSLTSLVASGRAAASTTMQGAHEYDVPAAAQAKIELEGSFPGKVIDASADRERAAREAHDTENASSRAPGGSGKRGRVRGPELCQPVVSVARGRRGHGLVRVGFESGLRAS